ncbi:hypothetical protein EA472_14155 [Natrarchaeobius oligotrophus]|uniref:Uncharacterized protein n=1 Tax=Natrarchaeobius chitinivorans TaxID=1679083 RepID=A0A3N6MWM1_NATCH|nr:hypothetical protein EA472_14155 [Natrarchaeobius chitinivorans]
MIVTTATIYTLIVDLSGDQVCNNVQWLLQASSPPADDYGGFVDHVGIYPSNATSLLGADSRRRPRSVPL